MPVQENGMNLSQYKGPVRICEFCLPEEQLLGRSCKWCMAQGYLSTCLQCRGQGKTTSGSVWDGGKSQHTSVCGICGGTGVFPAREVDYQRYQATTIGNGYGHGNGNGHGYSNNNSNDRRELPRAVHPMPNLTMSRNPVK